MTTDSCSYNTPGSINGWHSPETPYQNGAISKNTNFHNGYQERDNKNEEDNYRSERDDNRGKNIYELTNGLSNGLSNGFKNININNGVIPRKIQSRQDSNEVYVNNEKKGTNFHLFYFLFSLFFIVKV